MASRAASTVPPSPTGGATYCVTGSTTEKNITSVPMPAANSMEAQAKVENSGREWAGPRRIVPKREMPR